MSLIIPGLLGDDEVSHSKNTYGEMCDMSYAIDNGFIRLSNTLYVMSKTGLLLCGHGSTKPYNKELITKTAALISENHPQYIVKCGFMEFNEPDIRTSLQEFESEDISSLAVVPLFLARGVHIDEDIPEILGFTSGQKKGTFKKGNTEIPMVYADPIGENPLLADLMVSSAERALTRI